MPIWAKRPLIITHKRGCTPRFRMPFTDLILLASMLVLALLLVRQERDSGLLSLVRSLPGGGCKRRWRNWAAFALSLLAVLALLYGVNLAYCAAAFGLGPLTRTIQSVPALMRCTMQITVGQYLFRFLLAKWAGAFVMGLWVMLAALVARRRLPDGRRPGRAARDVRHPRRDPGHQSAERHQVCKPRQSAADQRTFGNYRNLYWFGSPIGLPLVEWTAAVVYGGALGVGFCWVFARAQLLSAAKRGFLLGLRHKTHATSIYKEEARKLLLLNGAALVLAAFAGFGIYQGVTAESYIGPDEIYYAYYMKHISGPFTQESYDWLEQQGEEFAPLLEGNSAASGVPYDVFSLRQKYIVYNQIINQNINYYLKEHPGAWLVYESGYRELFGFAGDADVQDTLLAGLACALCFSGLFSMERRGGMETILCTTPLGRKRTVRAKLAVSAGVAVLIAAASCLPHLIQVLRDYGLPVLFAPAMSISEFESLPAFVTLSDVLLFWFVCRIAACSAWAQSRSHWARVFGNLLPALFVSAVGYCLPALLSLSGMDGGIEWLGFWPLFHAANFFTTQG